MGKNQRKNRGRRRFFLNGGRRRFFFFPFRPTQPLGPRARSFFLPPPRTCPLFNLSTSRSYKYVLSLFFFDLRNPRAHLSQSPGAEAASESERSGKSERGRAELSSPEALTAEALTAAEALSATTKTIAIALFLFPLLPSPYPASLPSALFSGSDTGRASSSTRVEGAGRAREPKTKSKSNATASFRPTLDLFF